MPGGIVNIFGAEDPELSAAFNALASASVADHDAAAQKVTDVAVDHALSLPIAAVNTTLMYNKKLQGLEFTKGNGVPTYVTAWTSK